MAERDDQYGKAAPARENSEFRYRGDRFGLPEEGLGSVPSVPRRLAGLAIDWLLATLVARAFFESDPTAVSYVTLLVFASQSIVLLTLVGTTVGKRLAGVRVGALHGAALPWPVAIVVRTVLQCLVIPAVVYDRDHRGLHDRAAATITLRV